MTRKHHPIPAAHFNAKILRALAKRGIYLNGSTWLPDASGNFANGETGYELDDNGTCRIRTYREVRAIAGFAL
jgi:hypothetical protein